jgi:hypothetical protein
MIKLHVPLLILAIAVPLVSGSPSWAAKNNGGGSGANRCPSGSSNLAGYNACTNWCHDHNATENSRGACDVQCYSYWCGKKTPSTTNPVKGTNTPPIINGKPVEAPLPNKGGTPGNAAPIIKGKPIQASPGTGASPTGPTHPILEERGGSTKH